MYSCTFSYIVTNKIIVCTKIYTLQAANSKSEFFFLIHEIVEQIIMYQNAAILQKLWLKQKTTYFIHYLRYGFIFKILCYSSGIMYFNTISANQNAAFSLHLTTFHRYEICCTRLTPAKVSDLYPLLNAQNFV